MTKSEYDAARYAANAKGVKERMRLYREANREKINQKECERRAARSPERVIADKEKEQLRKNRPGAIEARRKQQRRYRETNKTAVKARKKTFYRNNREKIIATVMKGYKENPQKVWDRMLLKKYGLTRAAYDAMFAAQGGVCAICGGTTKGRKRKGLHVDHCHKTGKVRALLCSGCNVKVGAHESELHAKIMAYLRKHAE